MFNIKKFKNSNVQTSVRFPEDIYNKITKIANDNDMSINNVILSCVKYALENME